MGKEENRIKSNFKEANIRNDNKRDMNLMSKSYDKCNNQNKIKDYKINIEKQNFTDRKYDKSHQK